jgi:hypothetical protein
MEGLGGRHNDVSDFAKWLLCVEPAPLSGVKRSNILGTTHYFWFASLVFATWSPTIGDFQLLTPTLN